MAGAPIISMALYGERYEDDWFAAENSADFTLPKTPPAVPIPSQLLLTEAEG